MKTTFKYKSVQACILSLVAVAGVLMVLSTTSKALDNTNYGTGALQSGTTTGVYDSAFGFDALHANTAGAYNTAFGVNALLNITVGNYNTATGVNALAATVKGSYDTASGYQALRLDTTGTGNTASGANALYNCTTDSQETAFGYEALYSDKVGYEGFPNQNVAVGYQALYSSTNGYSNVAVGYQALYDNTTGYNGVAIGYSALAGNTIGTDNVAIGHDALVSNTNGSQNVADGSVALYFNTSGSDNTATGYGALYQNTTASNNVATGAYALDNNDFDGSGSAIENTADGTYALKANLDGADNTAVGFQALESGSNCYNNVAVGANALQNNGSDGSNAFGSTAAGYNALTGLFHGFENTAIGEGALESATNAAVVIAIGAFAGSHLIDGQGDIYLGDANGGSGAVDDPANEYNTIRLGEVNTQTATYIAGIYNQSYNSNDSPLAVFVDSTGKLGTNAVAPSSRQFKKDIKPMGDASSVILSLKPVTFQYIKPEYDPRGGQEFGLIAEEVDKVCPQLVARNPDGKIYGIRYDAVNAMLLNEFLKEHKRVEEQSQAIAAQNRINAQEQQEIATLTANLKEQAALLQKVSAQLQLGKSTPQVVANNN